MRGTTLAAVMAAWAWSAGCGGSNPARPLPVPESTPVPAPTPVATPIPSPTPCDCEAPVTNTNPPARLTLRLYSVENLNGAPKFHYDPSQGIPVGWVARLDVVGKDESGSETIGRGEIEFHLSEPQLVKVSGNHTHQRRLKVLEPGELTCWVTQDGVRSNDLVLLFIR
jgi:hypothetical protein